MVKRSGSKKKDCLFCKIREFDYYSILKICESKYFFCIFDSHPVLPRHFLIIPKRHVVSILDLRKNEWEDLRGFMKKAIKLVSKKLVKKLYNQIIKAKITNKSSIFCNQILQSKFINKRPTGYNIGNNEGIAAGRTIHHLHIQIIPRYNGDVKNSVGGIRNIISRKGDYRT